MQVVAQLGSALLSCASNFSGSIQAIRLSIAKIIRLAWLSLFMMFQAVVLVGGKYGPLCSGPSCQVVTACMGFPAQLYRPWGHLRTEMAAHYLVNIMNIVFSLQSRT